MEGFPIWLAIPVGVMLIVFEAILYLNNKKLLWVCLLVFSILMTQSGQFFDLMKYRKSDTSIEINNDNNLSLVTINKRKLERAERELDSITTDQSGWYYRREQAQKSYDEALQAYTELTKEVTVSVTGDTKEIMLDRFKYYSFGNEIAEKILMFLFQLALSIFLSLGAPVCLSLRKPKVKKVEVKQGVEDKPVNNNAPIDLIIRVLMHDGKEIKPFDKVQKTLKLHGFDYSKEFHKKVVAKLYDSDIIELDGKSINGFNKNKALEAVNEFKEKN